MNRFFRSTAASLAVVACLLPVAASAQEARPTSGAMLSVDQVRRAYSQPGYQLDQTLNWDWTSPPVSSFHVVDPSGRLLMVLVYPSDDAAVLARSQAQRVPGYGESAWRGNVALVQTTQAELERAYRAQTDRENAVHSAIDFSQPDTGVPSVAVDADFLQALDNSVTNL